MDEGWRRKGQKRKLFIVFLEKVEKKVVPWRELKV
jgi:hypothetical protein